MPMLFFFNIYNYTGLCKLSTSRLQKYYHLNIKVLSLNFKVFITNAILVCQSYERNEEKTYTITVNLGSRLLYHRLSCTS